MIDDVNDDGIDRSRADGLFPPITRAFVIYGSDSTLPALIDVVDLLPGQWRERRRRDRAGHVFGFYIDDAGDFNGDGFNDIVTFGPWILRSRHSEGFLSSSVDRHWHLTLI